MVQSNSILYGKDEHPDHVVVIKYVPYVGDSKRAMDEYTSEIMMGGHNTLVIHNTCEDSLLASPLILDLAILGELCSRIKVHYFTIKHVIIVQRIFRILLFHRLLVQKLIQIFQIQNEINPQNFLSVATRCVI